VVYKKEDFDNEEIEGVFYEPELQKVTLLIEKLVFTSLSPVTDL
jgi:hypothetical protein